MLPRYRLKLVMRKIGSHISHSVKTSEYPWIVLREGFNGMSCEQKLILIYRRDASDFKFPTDDSLDLLWLWYAAAKDIVLVEINAGMELYVFCIILFKSKDDNSRYEWKTKSILLLKTPTFTPHLLPQRSYTQNQFTASGRSSVSVLHQNKPAVSHTSYFPCHSTCPLLSAALLRRRKRLASG